MLFSLHRSALVVGILSLSIAGAGCSNYDEEGDAAATDELVNLQYNGKDFGVAKTNVKVEKSFSISKDYNLGTANAFAASAIIKANAQFDLDGALNIKPTLQYSQLKKLSATMNGTWSVIGGVDVSLRFTGNGAKNINTVKQASADLAKMVRESRVLSTTPLGKVNFPLGQVSASMEFVLDCSAGSTTEFDARVETSVKAPVAYEMVWDRDTPVSEVKTCSKDGKPTTVTSRWSFTKGKMTPTYSEPKLTISKAVGEVTFQCSIMPRFKAHLEFTAGSALVAEGQLEAYVEGGLRASANANADAQAKTWSGAAKVGALLNGGVQLNATALCGYVEINETKTWPMLGTTPEGILLKEVSKSGTF